MIGLVLRLRVFSRIRDAPSITCFRSSYMEPVTSNTKARVEALSSDSSPSSTRGCTKESAKSLCTLIKSARTRHFSKALDIFFPRFTASVSRDEANNAKMNNKKVLKSLDFSATQASIGLLPVDKKNICNDTTPVKHFKSLNNFHRSTSVRKVWKSARTVCALESPRRAGALTLQTGAEMGIKRFPRPNLFFCECV